jgi:preprotein translocase subunit SecB
MKTAKTKNRSGLKLDHTQEPRLLLPYVSAPASDVKKIGYFLRLMLKAPVDIDRRWKWLESQVHGSFNTVSCEMPGNVSCAE